MNLTAEQEAEVKALMDRCLLELVGAPTMHRTILKQSIREAFALGQSFNAELLRDALEIAPYPNRDALMLMWYQRYLDSLTKE